MKQLTSWEAVRTNGGTFEVKAKFQRGNSTCWVTICDCYAVDGRNAEENAVFIAELINAYNQG